MRPFLASPFDVTTLRRGITLKARHRSSGLNSRFLGEPTFAEYVQRTRDMLYQFHLRSASADLERVVEGNAPFELIPSAVGTAGKQKTYRRGILLTHGLSDSPYFMKYLAGFFQMNGFRVMAILLPGHGTQPGDLLDVRWQDWSDAVAYGTERLSEEVDEIYLGGYSAGATLSVNQSLYDDRVRGLFLFSPAFKISGRAALANLHKLYSWLIPSAMWVDIKPDLDIYKYESFPKNAATQMYALTKAVGAKLRESGVVIPVFAAASVDDSTVDPLATLHFIDCVRHPSCKLVFYTTNVSIFSSEIAAGKIELVNSKFPEQKILSFAHTSIVISPCDEHYGMKGSYSNCIHYYPDQMEKFSACLKYPERDNQGEITGRNLQSGILRRLMYNPNIDELKISMQQFMDSLN